MLSISILGAILGQDYFSGMVSCIKTKMKQLGVH